LIQISSLKILVFFFIFFFLGIFDDFGCKTVLFFDGEVPNIGSNILLIYLLWGSFPLFGLLPEILLLLGAIYCEMSIFFAEETCSSLHEVILFFNGHPVDVHSIRVMGGAFEVPLLLVSFLFDIGFEYYLLLF